MAKALTILFVLFSLLSLGQERTFQLWNKNQVVVETGDRVSLELSQKIHYTPESGEVDLKYGELFVEVEPRTWLEYGAGLRVSSANKYNGSWLHENRPMVYLSLTKEIKRLEFSFTNRVEYRTFEDVNDYLRHKQCLKLELPSITEWGMQFYFAEESYYKLNGEGTHCARFYSGVKALDWEHFAMKLYYSLQRTKGTEQWYSSDIVGLNLSISI